MSGTSGGPRTAEELMAVLRPIQEKKGFYFNKAESLAIPILEQLLTTRARYGYMVCPCRLPGGEMAKDRDIICPCRYREADVAEYGVCFCGLYVSEACKDEPLSRSIPDRRPPELIA